VATFRGGLYLQLEKNMTYEKLKETRMKIAYNIMQGFAASGNDFDEDLFEKEVEFAYKIADEVLKQGRYPNVL